MTDKKTPAFPQKETLNSDYHGMTLRDYFAAHALQGMLCNGFMPHSVRPDSLVVQKYDYVAAAYVLADQMLEARK